FADLMLGYYGASIAEKNPEVVQRAIEHYKGQKPPITCRPADLIPNEWNKLREETLKLEGNNGSDEDVLTYAMFPQVAPKFFQERAQGPKSVASDPNKKPKAQPQPGDENMGVLTRELQYAITFNGKEYQVKVAPAD
ncbi:MAG: oxaloacetate decarboxylase, partial [Armatimonadetes bacterium]|nr:oxaloacetate decarboxylase [Armatimonadota bacterium]